MAVSASGAVGRNTDLHLQVTKLWGEQRESSPERTVIWSKPVNNGGEPKRVPVLYYLSRNGQLEHPHFMEVPLSSHQGLFLTDVLNRLNVLRGKGMASLYSWSCKRSYKNRFVWHDLSENDFIYPAHGHEYVLKGSELPENPFLDINSPFPREQPTLPQPPPPPESRRIGGGGLHSPGRERVRRRRNKSCSSIDLEYNVYKAETFPISNAADASTQTDYTRRRRPLAEIVEEENCKEPQGDEIAISPPPSDSSPETLETLMKAVGRTALRPETSLEHPAAANIRDNHHQHIQRCRSSVLMQLISCGSLPFKDCVAGPGMALIGQYRTRVPRGGGTAENGSGKLEEKAYFSGSLVETKKEEFLPALKRSTSYNADRIPHLELLDKEIEGVRAKCIPRKPKFQSSTRKKGTADIACRVSTINGCTLDGR